MKRLLFLATALLLSSQIYAADNIGYLDMDRILQSYKEADRIMHDIKGKREEYQKFLEEKQAEIDKAKENKEKEEKIKERIQKLEAEIKPKQEEILKRESEIQRSLFSKIIETAKVIAKEYGIDTVLDKRVVYIGGFDLTEFVTDKLNK